MALFDALTSTRRPRAGTPVASAEAVRAALLAVGRDSAPFRVVEVHDPGVAAPDPSSSASDGGADLVAEWRIAEAAWREVFGKAGVRKVFRILLKLDPEHATVRAVDREYSVTWEAGWPHLSLAATAFRGQVQEVEFGRAYAYSETLVGGEVLNYRFDTREIKRPLQEAVTACGWTYRGVAFGRL